MGLRNVYLNAGPKAIFHISYFELSDSGKRMSLALSAKLEMGTDTGKWK